QPGGDGGRTLLHARAAGGSGLGADRMVRVGRAQGRQSVHGAQSAGAALAAAQRSMGQYRASEADAAQIQITSSNEKARWTAGLSALHRAGLGAQRVLVH